MKKILLLLLAAVSIKTYGQLEYTFVKSTSTYSELTSPTVVSDAWKQNFVTVLPFQFTYFTKPFDSLRITPNSISFTLYGTDFIAMGQEDYYFDGELFPVGSEISYLITGTAPNRIVKVQYKNLKVNTTDDTVYTYNVNNQIWLYETSNKIEFHFGPNVIDDINFTEFYFGFRDSDGTPYLAISGSVGSPTLVKVTNVGTFKGITAHPANGTLYTFEPYTPSTSVSRIAKPYTFYASEQLFSYTSPQNSTLVISDISGKVITEIKPDTNTPFLYDYSNLSRGMYLVTINANDQLFSEKIIVK